MSENGTEQAHPVFKHIKRKFLFLLVPLVVLLAVQPLAAEAVFPQWGLDGLVILILLAILRMLRKNRTLFTIGLVLVLLTIIGILGVETRGDGATTAAAELLNFGAISTLFTLAAVYIAVEAVREQTITVDTLWGVVSVYLLISLSFSFVYLLLETSRAGSFAGVPATSGTSSGVLLADLSYFSLVTITTLGYGDISPIHPLARSIATAEAVFGQFFVAAVVGLLVSRKTSQPMPTAGR